MNAYYPTEPNIIKLGRVQINADNSATWGYPGAGFRLRTNSRHVTMEACSSGDDSYIGVRINAENPQRLQLTQQRQTFPLLSQTSNSIAELEIIHYTETWQGKITVTQFFMDGQLLAPPATRNRRILFVGDSVTCGEGAARDGTQECNKSNHWWNAHQSYGWLTGEALNAEVHLVCFGGRGLIRSSDGSVTDLNGPDYYQLTIPENTAPAWRHAAFDADIVVVSLGTNDFNLGIGELPDENTFVSAYVSFVHQIAKDYPRADIIITDGAIVNDGDPSRPQKTVLRHYLQQTQQQAKLSRVHIFESSHFPGDHCDGHPTGPQHQQMSQELTEFIRQLKRW